jgi:hypothetical protein
MTRNFLLTLSVASASALASGGLHAQSAAIMPAAPLDARRLEARNALVALRDSLNTVSSAAARLQRDFRGTSALALTGRARALASACDRSGRMIAPARAVVAGMPAATSAQRRYQDSLVKALGSLSATILRCGTEFGAMAAPGKGEEVRGYGNRRAEPLIAAISEYSGVAQGFFSVYDIEVRPPGAGKNPLAS